MFLNHHVDARIKTPDNTVIEPVENVSYLGSWISNTEHDLKVRQASAWIACNKIRKVWTSKTPQRSDYLKQLWSLSYSMEVKRGPWPRSWRKVSMDATRECCKQPEWALATMNNHELYRSLPRVSETICVRRVSIITSLCPTIIVDKNKIVKKRKKIFWRYYFDMTRS